jgi:hypothetical protein
MSKVQPSDEIKKGGINMSDHTQDEAKIRNKKDEDGDSLMEKTKLENGVDIEPEADEWIAKPSPVSYDDTNSSSKK